MKKLFIFLFVSLYSIQMSAQDAVCDLKYKGVSQTKEESNWEKYDYRFFASDQFNGIDSLGLKAIEFYVFTDTSEVLDVLFDNDTSLHKAHRKLEGGTVIQLISNYNIELEEELPAVPEELIDEEEVVASDIEPAGSSDGEYIPRAEKKQKIKQWQAVKAIENKPGKYILIVGWVNDLSKTEIQQAFILNVMKDLEFSSFDALEYYTQNSVKTEKTIVGFIEAVIGSVLSGDTLSYYNHLGNLNDFNFIASIVLKNSNDQIKKVDRERESFIRDFTKNYNDFNRLQERLDGTFGNDTSLSNYEFQIEEKKRMKYGFTQFRLKVHLKLVNNKEVYFKLNAVQTDRGIVLTNTINPRFKDKYSVTLNTNFSREGVRYRMANKDYINQPLHKFVNDFQGYYTHWAFENGDFVLYSNSDKMILKGVDPFKTNSFLDVGELLLKEVKVVSNHKSIKIDKNHTHFNYDVKTFTSIEYSEYFFDQVLQNDYNWVMSNFIDSNDFNSLVENVFPDTIPLGISTKKGSLARYKNRMYRKFNNTQFVSKEYFNTIEEATNSPWTIYQKEEAHPSLNKSQILIGYTNTGLELTLQHLYQTKDGLKFTTKMKMKNESFNISKIPGLFTQDQGLKLIKETKISKMNLVEYLKMHESEILNWKFKYENEKVIALDFTFLVKVGNLYEVEKQRVFVSEIPSSFYAQKIQYRRLYQMRDANILGINTYNILPIKK